MRNRYDSLGARRAILILSPQLVFSYLRILGRHEIKGFLYKGRKEVSLISLIRNYIRVITSTTYLIPYYFVPLFLRTALSKETTRHHRCGGGKNQLGGEDIARRAPRESYRFRISQIVPTLPRGRYHELDSHLPLADG